MCISNAILDVQGYQDILMKLEDMTLLLGKIPAFRDTAGDQTACLKHH